MTGEPGAADQALGIGDGVRTRFPLVKTYDGQVRRITRPVAGTVRVSVGGVELAGGWTLQARGVVELDEAPAEGAEVAAGFRFDVPVRFAEDRLSLEPGDLPGGGNSVGADDRDQGMTPLSGREREQEARRSLRFFRRSVTSARMVNKHSARRPAFLVAGIAALLLALAYLQFAGSAVVLDRTGGVESAFIVTGDGREQQLYRLWPGYFYAIPQLEGLIEVRCRGGTRKSWGYVTGNMHTKIRVVGDTPCARIVEVH